MDNYNEGWRIQEDLCRIIGIVLTWLKYLVERHLTGSLSAICRRCQLMLPVQL